MYKQTVSTFLRYPGGKSKAQARNQIKQYFPESFGEYRENFLGGAGIFFSIDPSIPRWINDLNRPLIAVYEALKARPKEFLAQCMAIAPATDDEPLWTKPSGVTYPKRLWDLFYSLRDDPTADDALRYLFLNRCSMLGRVILDPKRSNRTTFANPKGWSNGLFERLAQASEVLKDARITCSDYEWLLDEPGDDVLVYCDAPYMKETLFAKSAKLYEWGFSLDDHTRLRDAVARSKHKVILSYDDHSDIRELYKKLYIHTVGWPYISRKDKKVGRELVITNYPVLKLSSETEAVEQSEAAVPENDSPQIEIPEHSRAVLLETR